MILPSLSRARTLILTQMQKMDVTDGYPYPSWMFHDNARPWESASVLERLTEYDLRTVKSRLQRSGL